MQSRCLCHELTLGQSTSHMKHFWALLSRVFVDRLATCISTWRHGSEACRNAERVSTPMLLLLWKYHRFWIQAVVLQCFEWFWIMRMCVASVTNAVRLLVLTKRWKWASNVLPRRSLFPENFSSAFQWFNVWFMISGIVCFVSPCRP